MQVRGRPALRVLTNNLEPLKNHPGSEFWQELIDEYEEPMVAAAAATGAAIVDWFESGNPPWVQGSAWLAAPNRAVTNRHVLLPEEEGAIRLVEEAADHSGMRLRKGCTVRIEFASDDRTPGETMPRRVTDVLYVARPEDPVDIAVLAIEPYERPALAVARATDPVPHNLFVVGHPALMARIPAEVRAVFGHLDGRKRVSFGQRLAWQGPDGVIAYDASTVGGYSGAP